MTRTARPLLEYISVVLRPARAVQDLEYLGVRARACGKRGIRRGGPAFTVDVGDDATGGPHQRDSGGVVPHVTTETD